MGKNGKCAAWCKKHLKILIASAIVLVIAVVLLALIPTFILASVNGTYYFCVDGQVQEEGYIKLSTGKWTNGKQSGKYKIKGSQITFTSDTPLGEGSDAQAMAGTIQNKVLVIEGEESALRYRAKGHRHELSDWKTVIAPTCEKEGLDARTCRCGYGKSRTEAIVDHNTENGFCVFCGRSQMRYGLDREINGYVVNGFAEGFENSQSVEIPSVYKKRPVVKVGSYAFRGNMSLTSVVIPDGVMRIEDNAFYECSFLKSVVIPDSMTSIGSGVFRDCTSLTSVTLGNGLTKIGASAFMNCTSLTSVTLGDSVTTIGGSAFQGCSSLKSIVIPNCVTGFGSSAFAGCSSLNSIVIPANVRIIGSSAFYACSSLTIYCERAAMPSSWDSDWNVTNCPVVWEYKKSISE